MLRPARREPGFAVGTGIHLIDAVLSFMGPPRSILTVRAPTDHSGRFLYDALFSFEAGRSAAVVISPDVGAEEETFEIHGQGYSVQVDAIRCAVRVFEGGQEVLWWQPEKDAAYQFVCGALGETERFIAALREGRGFAPDLADALVSMRASEAVEAGGEVALEE
jgi:predicted dehydrogenase